jgi:hypothetical protein
MIIYSLYSLRRMTGTLQPKSITMMSDTHVRAGPSPNFPPSVTSQRRVKITGKWSSPGKFPALRRSSKLLKIVSPYLCSRCHHPRTRLQRQSLFSVQLQVPRRANL